MDCAPAMSGTDFFILASDVEAAVKTASPARRARMLGQVAAFFIAQFDRLSPAQLCVFDDVLVRLMLHAEARTLAALSTVLADAMPAPQQTIRRLAFHEDPAVAVPILDRSGAISDADLVDIARNCGQIQLAAIAKRQRLHEALTDTILKHAGKETTRILARNAGACFSKQGYTILLQIAGRDDTVAESLGLHPDLPAEMLQTLLSRTTDVVRTRLLKASPSALRQRIQAVLGAIPIPANPKTSSDDLAEARAAIVTLNKTGKLNDSTVNRFAIRREHANVIAALVLLSGADIDIIAPLIDEVSGRGLIIACRASRLNWQTTTAVLNNRRVPPLSKEQLEQARDVFEMLYVSSAQYTIRFEMPAIAASGPGSHDDLAAAAGGHA